MREEGACGKFLGPQRSDWTHTSATLNPFRNCLLSYVELACSLGLSAEVFDKLRIVRNLRRCVCLCHNVGLFISLKSVS